MRSVLLRTLSVVTLSLAMTVSCSREQTDVTPSPLECRPDKVAFDMNTIDDNGLTGPADGKVSVDYEFCIPLNAAARQEVSAIDPEIHCRRGPGMRIGCTVDQYACVGNTGYQDFQEILCALSVKDYITRIDRTWWE